MDLPFCVRSLEYIKMDTINNGVIQDHLKESSVSRLLSCSNVLGITNTLGKRTSTGSPSSSHLKSQKAFQLLSMSSTILLDSHPREEREEGLNRTRGSIKGTQKDSDRECARKSVR